ncbi:MAG: ABC transporter permease, partial [Pseudomonadota bacterium]|nr:ABC transporter permease [Pseudomonadota bacterium]
MADLPAAAEATPSGIGAPPLAVAAPSLSPNQRAWRRFRRNRIGTVSLWLFIVLLVLATAAELISNDRPLAARYNGELFFPLLINQPETRFGGDFKTPTDWKDPFIAEQFAKPGNWAFFTFNPHSAKSVDYFEKLPSPIGPSRVNWLGTDSDGHDMVARLLYGFRVSIWFAFALTLVGTVIGILMGALQGYFGGRVGLF